MFSLRPAVSPFLFPVHIHVLSVTSVCNGVCACVKASSEVYAVLDAFMYVCVCQC